MMWGMTARKRQEPSRRRPADTFGGRLARVRQDSGGLTVAAAAGRVGIDDSSWRNWEAGRAKPRDLIAVCRRISEEFGYEYEWLVLGGALEPPSTRWYLPSAA